MKTYNSLNEIENEINNNPFVFLYVSSSNCNVCKNLFPKITKITNNFSKIVTVFAELDNIPEISGKYSIFSVPTMILFIDKKEMFRESRYVNMFDLENNISKYYKLYFEGSIIFMVG